MQTVFKIVVASCILIYKSFKASNFDYCCMPFAEGISYYLADSSGMPVCGEDGMLQVCNPDSTTSTVKWTLRKYIELQGTYPSKLRLYCVEKVIGEEICA